MARTRPSLAESIGRLGPIMPGGAHPRLVLSEGIGAALILPGWSRS
jgi:hypothetical protein